MADQNKQELSEELQGALIDIVNSCEKEDDEIRQSMTRQWKKNEEFWHGVQYLFWSDRDADWRSPLDMGWNDDDAELTEELGSFSDKVVDIFRGHGEAIIAALAAQVPALRYLPDDADDANDVVTARTKSKVAELVQRHNKAKLVFLRALFFLAIHGLVASYRYAESDFKYGSIKTPDIGAEKRDIPIWICEDCDFESREEVEACPQCGSPNIVQEMKKTSIPVVRRMRDLPKSRVKIDVFGPLHFKVSVYARNQAECTYFLLFGDLGKDTVKAAFPNLEEKVDGEHLDGMSRFSRSDFMSSMDPEVSQQGLVTVKKCWLRPEALYRCTNKELRAQLQEKFPSGVKVTLIGKNNIFAGAEEESLDDRWEIGQAGLSTFIYSDPILRPLVQIQEMRNDLVNLILETIKHGIPSTFADPGVVNFDQYGKFEAVPGYMYKTKAARPGEPIGNSFYDTSRSTLSREVAMFLQQLDKDAQFCIGSFPSVYGGPAEGKTRTFSEYAASRQMALQRLSITWTFVTDWWVRTISGAVDLYVNTLLEDEHYTTYQDDNYVKVSIRRQELAGKVGGVEPEGSETFPVSLAQKKDLILKLIELNNDFINQALYLPDNARVIQDVLGLNEFKLPGEGQRVKQSVEIGNLVRTEPIGPQQSSVPIDPDVDDSKVHIATIAAWAVSEIGLACRDENPQGYANVMAHKREHLMNLVKQTLQQNETAPGQAPQTTQQEVKE